MSAPMKRTTLMVDRQLLDEAARLAGDRSYSRTVNGALAEFVRRAAKAGRIFELQGAGRWEGEVGDMRRDAPMRARDLGKRS